MLTSRKSGAAGITTVRRRYNGLGVAVVSCEACLSFPVRQAIMTCDYIILAFYFDHNEEKQRGG